MRIISEAIGPIAKVWGAPAPADTTYRLLRYHVREDCDEGSLLFNTVTGELVLLDAGEADLLGGLPASHVPKMDDLIAHRFLVPESFDDAKSVNQLRKVLRKLTTGNNITSYSILPTSTCNARCFYCYESGYPKKSMTLETADKVVDYIEAHCGEQKRIQIQWFGGEPTLGEERIDQICSGLTEKGIAYTSFTISNGYLFTKDLARKAKEKWKLVRAQISMDGTEDVYNKAKAYVNAEGSPYQRVLENIGNLLDESISVVVRMNLDSHNTDDLKALIDELIGRYGKRGNFSAYVREIFENRGYDPVSHSVEERQRLIAIKTLLNRRINESGCGKKSSLSADASLPCLKTIFCMADNPQSLLINPLGQFGKCDHHSFVHLVGDLERGHNFATLEASAWLDPDYTEWCKKCFLFPICGRPEFCIGNRKCYPEELQEQIQGIKTKMQNKLVSENGDGRK